MKTELTFDELRTANKLRVTQFKNKLGKLSHPPNEGGIDNWSIAEWTNAMAGECGEACNIAKKIIRGDFSNDPELGLGLLLDEIADVVIYADLCCTRAGRQLGIAVCNKFNEKSDDLKIDVKLHA